MRASIIYNRVTRSSSISSPSTWTKATVHGTCRSMSMLPNKNKNSNNNNNTTAAKTKSTTEPENVIDVASSYMNNIRMKIATTLASSMTDQDRQQLFTSLNVNVHGNETVNDPQKEEEKNETDQQNTMSINEAVAQALAKEASKREQLLEQERKDIMEQAEIAARKRVENDLLLRERQINLKKWEQELKEEQLMEHQQEENESGNENQEELHDDDHHHHHPILGKVFIDFGYKRVHIISVKKLAAIPIWEKQRVYRHDRAKLMAKDKLKTLDIGLPGVVALHEGLDGELSIIDGQHRVGMLAILEAKKAASTSISTSTTKEDNDNTNTSHQHQLDLDEILVEVFPQTPTSSPTHAQDLFVEINKAEPVKLVDMPGVAKKTDRKIINDAATYLLDTYPEMFKPSQRCRPPHLNIDNLRDAIFASGMLKKHKIKSKTALLKWILEKNAEMKKTFVGETKKDGSGGGGGVNTKALEKAKKFNFYLGLDLSWLHQ